jgi:hypothetical protein
VWVEPGWRRPIFSGHGFVLFNPLKGRANF